VTTIYVEVFIIGIFAGLAIAALLFVAGGVFAIRSTMNTPESMEKLMKMAADEFAARMARNQVEVMRIRLMVVERLHQWAVHARFN